MPELVTRRIETSKYPQEKKATAIPLVRATEKGTGQTEAALRGVSDVGFGPGFFLTFLSEVCWKAAR